MATYPRHRRVMELNCKRTASGDIQCSIDILRTPFLYPNLCYLVVLYLTNITSSLSRSRLTKLDYIFRVLSNIPLGYWATLPTAGFLLPRKSIPGFITKVCILLCVY